MIYCYLLSFEQYLYLRVYILKPCQEGGQVLHKVFEEIRLFQNILEIS